MQIITAAVIKGGTGKSSTIAALAQAASLVRYINGGSMNAQERESVRVTLSVANNAYRKAQRKAKREAATRTD